MKRGRRLGIDLGEVRVGLASSDPDGLVATPLETARREDAPRRIVQLCRELDIVEIFLGMPLGLDGREGAAAKGVRSFAQELVKNGDSEGVGDMDVVDVPVFLIDERLTTVTAHQALSASGRKHRSHRVVVDQVAAVLILQHALDASRSSGTVAGEQIAQPDRKPRKPRRQRAADHPSANAEDHGKDR